MGTLRVSFLNIAMIYNEVEVCMGKKKQFYRSHQIKGLQLHPGVTQQVSFGYMNEELDTYNNIILSWIKGEEIPDIEYIFLTEEDCLENTEEILLLVANLQLMIKKSLRYDDVIYHLMNRGFIDETKAIEDSLSQIVVTTKERSFSDFESFETIDESFGFESEKIYNLNDLVNDKTS